MSNLGQMMSDTATGKAAGEATGQNMQNFQRGLESMRYGQQTPILNRQLEAKTGIDEQTLAEAKLNALAGILPNVKDEASYQAAGQLADKMGIDTSGFFKQYPSYGDGSHVQAINNTVQAHLQQAKAQEESVGAMGKGAAQAAQLLEGAAASGNQDVYDKTIAQLKANGIDVSNYAPDITTGGAQAKAIRIAQSPIGSILNAGANIAKTTGNIPTIIQDYSPSQNSPAPASQPNAPVRQPITGGQIAPTQPVNNIPTNITQEAPTFNTSQPIGKFGNSPIIQTSSGQPVAVTSSGVPQFVPPPYNPNKTPEVNQHLFEQALKVYQTNPDILAANKKAETAAGKLGEDMGDTAKTLNVMNSSLPSVLQRFQNMRDASAHASFGYGINKEGEGAAVDFASSSLGDSETDKANTLLKSAVSQGVLPELGPMLAATGVKGNKFLENIASTAVGLELDKKPATKLAAIDRLENQYINNYKIAAEKLRNNGLPAPTPEEIDAQTAAYKKAGTSNPMAISNPPAESFKGSDVSGTPEAHALANQYTPAQLKAALDKKRAARANK